MEDEFLNSHIDDTCDEDNQEIEATEVKVWQLIDNTIPRGPVPLEELFDRDDVTKNHTMDPIEKGVEDVNIGKTDKPRMVKLSKSLSSQMKCKYIDLIT